MLRAFACRCCGRHRKCVHANIVHELRSHLFKGRHADGAVLPHAADGDVCDKFTNPRFFEVILHHLLWRALLIKVRRSQHRAVRNALQARAFHLIAHQVGTNTAHKDHDEDHKTGEYSHCPVFVSDKRARPCQGGSVSGGSRTKIICHRSKLSSRPPGRNRKEQSMRFQGKDVCELRRNYGKRVGKVFLPDENQAVCSRCRDNQTR